MSTIESQRQLRALELNAYRNMVDAFRAQGSLTKDKQDVLKRLATSLNVSEERSRSEIRRAVNDETLASIAQKVTGCSTEHSWRIESMRKVPLVPRVAPKSIFTPLADAVSDFMSRLNAVCFKKPMSQEEIRKRNIRTNLERIAEKKVLDPLIARIHFDETAIRETIDEVENFNTVPHPAEYVHVIEEPQERDNVVAERLSAAASSVPEPPSVAPNTVIVTTSAEIAIETFPAQEPPVLNIPSKPTKKVPIPVISSPTPKMVEVCEEFPRMVRKAKLNAKRWNPKTQTLESPSKITRIDLENNAKKKPRARKSTEKVGSCHQENRAVGDVAVKTPKSRRKVRRSYDRKNRGRDRRRRTKSDVAEKNVGEESSCSELDKAKEKLKDTLTVSVENNLNTPVKTVTNRSHLAYNDLFVPASKPSILSRDQSHGLRINILRKRVCSGATQLQEPERKKMLSSWPVTEVSKEYYVNSLLPDISDGATKSERLTPVPTSNVAKNSMLVNCTTKSNEQIENSSAYVYEGGTVNMSNESSENSLENVSKDISSSKSHELVSYSSSHASLEDTNANFKNVVESSAIKLSEEQVDQNSVQSIESSETNNDCTSTTEWNKSVLDSTTEKADCDSTTTSKDLFSASKEGTVTSDSSNDEPRRKVVSNSIERPKIRKPLLPNQGRGVKILPAGCGKLISQFLLGSNVRVRAVRERTQRFRKPSPRANVESADNADAHLSGEKADQGHMQEVADENESGNILMVEEEVLSGSDDDIRSASPMSSVQESRADSDDVVMSSDDEEVEKDGLSESVTRPDTPVSSMDADKLIENVILDTISVINEDWKDLDSVANQKTVKGTCDDGQNDETNEVKKRIEEPTEPQSGDERENNKNEVEKGMDESTESTSSMSSKANVVGSLSSIIGIPPWAPKVINANALPGTTYRHMLTRKPLQTYVPENTTSEVKVFVIEPTNSAGVTVDATGKESLPKNGTKAKTFVLKTNM